MKRIFSFALIAMICLQLSGCDFWMADYYVSVKPYVVQNATSEDEVLTAKTYMEVRAALEDLVEGCKPSAIISVPELDKERIDYYMEAAEDYILQNNPIGAYALDEISYEIGTNAGSMAIAVDITYNYNRIEVLRMKRSADTEAALKEIKKALQQYDADITLYIYNYDEIDFIQKVQDYVDAYPQICMEMPQVTVAVYPDTGSERVAVLSFTYRNSREVLRSMQADVQKIFADFIPKGETPWDKYVGLYSFLRNLHTYSFETSITPSYSLLRYGVGDSKAFATTYAAMCRRIGLECDVVSGTKDGIAWYWNIIQDGETLHHVDLIQCIKAESFFVLRQEQMQGYVWDYSAYPLKENDETLPADS